MIFHDDQLVAQRHIDAEIAFGNARRLATSGGLVKLSKLTRPLPVSFR